MPRARRVHVLFLAIFAVQAKLVNVTLDDQDAGLTYTPSDAWADGTDCEACMAKLETDKLVNGSWHDSTVCLQSGMHGDLELIVVSSVPIWR